MIKLGRVRIAQECGQRWYRPRSWRMFSTSRISGARYFTFFRRLYGGGFAVGPIMFWKEDK